MLKSECWASVAALALVVVAGAVLRIAGLDGQSFWRDEASTALELDRSFGGMLDAVHDDEATPPGYFVLAWLWTRPFGVGEVGLRSLSVVLGVATIPVVFAIGRLWSTRAGLLAALLVATNPFLVWYAQEGRAYALLALLSALAILFVLRDQPRAWALVAVLALVTHYHALLVLAPQAVVWLVRRRPLALLPPALAGLALLPLVVAQRDGRIELADTGALVPRIGSVIKHWVAGLPGTPADLLGAVAILLALAGLVLALRRARLLAALAAGPFAMALLLAVAGADYFTDRSLIGALVPALALIAIGFTPEKRDSPLFPAAVGCLTGLFVFFCVDIATSPSLQREDWRGLAARLGPSVVVTTPDGLRPLRWYAGATDTPPGGATHVVYVSSHRSGRARMATPPPPGPAFALAAREEEPTTTAVRFVATTPQPLDLATIGAPWVREGRSPIVLNVP